MTDPDDEPERASGAEDLATGSADRGSQPVIRAAVPAASRELRDRVHAAALGIDDSLRDLIDGPAVRLARELHESTRFQRELERSLGGIHGLGLASAADRAAIGMSVREVDTLMQRQSLMQGVIDRAGGLDRIGRQIEQSRRMIDAAGGIDAIMGRHSATASAIAAVGGIDAIMQRHAGLRDTAGAIASGSFAGSRYSAVAEAIAATTGSLTTLASRQARSDWAQMTGGLAALSEHTGGGLTAWKALQASEQALRDLGGVTSFATLLGRTPGDATGMRATLDAVMSHTLAWREEGLATSLSARLHADLPELFPERRRASPADFSHAPLSALAERMARDQAWLESVRGDMLGLRQPWIEVDDPGRSVAAYVEARALRRTVDDMPPESRRVIDAVRDDLGDYREGPPAPEEIVADPVLRTAFRLDLGYNSDLGSLPPAILVAIFSWLGIPSTRRIEVDPDALASAVHLRARRLELRLRRFIEARMMATYGPRWHKQKVPGETVTEWRRRRQIDLDNQRPASRLYDYAGFESYHAIIEQNDNWREVFQPVFKVRSAILESLRRLSLIRNPDAHNRVMTIEDLIDLAVEGRRIDRWIDAAG